MVHLVWSNILGSIPPNTFLIESVAQGLLNIIYISCVVCTLLHVEYLPDAHRLLTERQRLLQKLQRSWSSKKIIFSFKYQSVGKLPSYWSYSKFLFHYVYQDQGQKSNYDQYGKRKSMYLINFYTEVIRKLQVGESSSLPTKLRCKSSSYL